MELSVCFTGSSSDGAKDVASARCDPFTARATCKREALRSGAGGKLGDLFPGNRDAHFAQPLTEKLEHVLDSRSFTNQNAGDHI